MSTTYILNCVPSKSIPSTPYELWKSETPDLSIIHPKGCATYIHNTSHEYGKLGPKGKKYIFIRYSKFSKGYVFLGEDGRDIKIESRDVTFLEKDFPKRCEINGDSRLYEMENPDISGNIRHIDLAHLEQDDMGYHAPPEVIGSENLSDFSL